MSREVFNGLVQAVHAFKFSRPQHVNLGSRTEVQHPALDELKGAIISMKSQTLGANNISDEDIKAFLRLTHRWS